MKKLILALVLVSNVAVANDLYNYTTPEVPAEKQQTIISQNPYIAVPLTLLLAFGMGYAAMEGDRAGGGVCAAMGAGLGIVISTF